MTRALIRCLSLLSVVIGIACGDAGTLPTAPDAFSDCRLFPAQSSSPYRMPFEVGLQTLAGRTREHGDPQVYAIDWIVPIGTTVIASRSGRVIEVESQFSDDDHEFGHENRVFVQHDDGTVARYFHLRNGGALVVVGQLVSAGQRIGLSGNSGNSASPHLHFDVVPRGCSQRWPQSLGEPCQSTMPVTFVNTIPHPCGIESGRVYRVQ